MQCTVTWSPETGGGLVKPYPHNISGYGRPVWKNKAMEDEARRERRRRQRQKVVGCCKKFAAFMFSHIGLAAMVVAYSIMGGFLFRALEAPHEAKEKIRIRGEREDAIEKILNEASQMKMNEDNVVSNFTAKVRNILMKYQDEVVSAVKDSGWDGNDDTDVRALQWSFAGALLYAVTVITTIGYGHVAPKTEWGRLVTIVYALIGIPLTFLYLSNIGNFLANSFRLFYKKVCCDICCCQQCERKKKLQRIRQRRNAVENRVVQQNMALNAAPHPMQYGTRQDTIPIDEADYYVEDEILGLPGGDENMGFEDDVDSEMETQIDSRENLANSKKENEKLLKKDTERENAILGNDFMEFENARETDILDDEVDDDPPSRKPSKKKKKSSPPSDIHVSSGILDKLGSARETDILGDSEDECAGDNLSVPNRQLKKEGSVKKQKEEMRRSRSLKEQSKKDKKESKKAKKDRSRSKSEDGTKELSRKTSKKAKDGKKDKTLSDNKDLKPDSKNRGIEDEDEDEELPAYTSHSRSDSGKKRNGIEKNKQTKLSKKFFRKGTTGKKKDSPDGDVPNKRPSLRRKPSNKRRKSNSESEDDENDNLEQKGFHQSEESFVTAQGDSLSYVEKLNSENVTDEDEETEEDDEYQVVSLSGRKAKIALGPDVVTVEDDEYAMELMEYGAQDRFADDPFEYDDHTDDEKVTVPISICLIIIAGYIFAGAVLFTVWEDWDYLTGSYFCFITLSTIGFGDIVPGTDMKEWSSHSKLVSCSLWLAFGLSLLAMCFNLMQEEVKEKCKWLGKKLGLLKDENEA